MKRRDRFLEPTWSKRGVLRGFSGEHFPRRCLSAVYASRSQQVAGYRENKQTEFGGFEDQESSFLLKTAKPTAKRSACPQMESSGFKSRDMRSCRARLMSFP